VHTSTALRILIAPPRSKLLSLNVTLMASTRPPVRTCTPPLGLLSTEAKPLMSKLHKVSLAEFPDVLKWRLKFAARRVTPSAVPCREAGAVSRSFGISRCPDLKVTPSPHLHTQALRDQHGALHLVNRALRR
jgi:hypothetical protein